VRITEAPAALRRAGLPVVVLPGFERRGAPLERVEAIVEHCTVTPVGAKPASVAGLLRDGRSDLPGPLSQFGHDDDGVWWCIASGRCHHNGYGTHGNQAIGVEKMHPNVASVPYRGLDSWVRGSAVLAELYGVPVARDLGHKETDPRRKSDPAGLDMAAWRRTHARLRAAGFTEDFLSALTYAEQRELLDLLRLLRDRIPVDDANADNRMNHIVRETTTVVDKGVAALRDEIQRNASTWP